MLSEEEKLAFFINIFNVLTMHAHVEYGAPPVGGGQTREDWFARARYRLGPFKIPFSLHDIRFAVLRANMPRPSYLGKPLAREQS